MYNLVSRKHNNTYDKNEYILLIKIIIREYFALRNYKKETVG
jgi:hypothetical protein